MVEMVMVHMYQLAGSDPRERFRKTGRALPPLDTRAAAGAGTDNAWKEKKKTLWPLRKGRTAGRIYEKKQVRVGSDVESAAGKTKVLNLIYSGFNVCAA
jgi:hypothetical protein